MSLTTGITPSGIIALLLGFLLMDFVIRRKKRMPQGISLPPGPPRKPLIGNLTDMPSQQEWETFTQWGVEYGALVYLKVLGISIMLVNSLDVARDLFENRSRIYSDRPESPMLMMMGWDYNIGLMRYGEWWRRHRRKFHQYFNHRAAMAHHPIQIRHTWAFLRRLRDSPEDWEAHLKHLSASIILDVIYGIKIRPKGDRYLEIAQRAVEAAAQAGKPGAFLVDLLPVLQYVPEWVPGAGFKKKARLWREPTVEMSVAPFMAVKKALSAGTAEPSVMASWLKDLSHREGAPEDEEDVIRNTGALLLGGVYILLCQSEVATLSFILAMVLYPETQQKAQAELDTVLGDRLPTFEDRPNLPYTSALCTEVLRWHPVLPFSIPHVTTREDIYGDYFIPKGTLVLGNAWAILHDEKRYGPKPHEFRPERFLEPGANIPTAQYGFGRRICPGRYMASNTFFIVISSMLKVFNIAHARDADGNEIPVVESYTSGALVQPEPFSCLIRLRSASAGRLIPESTDD